MQLDRHYSDPRLVALYDLENSGRDDVEFYLRLADELRARTIVDLGCGTGVLARELAADNRRVIGVDPAAAMLAVARGRPGAEHVEWIEGDAAALGTPAADLVLMTGNVAQVFLDDAAWDATLLAIHAALRPGGYLAFESRNPDDRAWERWTPEATFERLELPEGAVECWLEVTDVDNGRVSMLGHNVFLADGEDVVAASTLRFRSRAELERSLNNAGFAVEQVFGDWQRGPVTASSRVLVLLAKNLTIEDTEDTEDL